MADVIQYYRYIHENSSLTTINECIQDPTNPLSGYSKNDSSFFSVPQIGVNIPSSVNSLVKDVLSFKDENGVTNESRVVKMYDSNQLETSSYKTNLTSGNDVLLLLGTELLIPYNKCNLEVQSILGNDQLIRGKYSGYINDYVRGLITEGKYLKGERSTGNFTEYKPSFEILIWVRSLNKIINVSKFSSTLTIKVGKGGGSFNFDLSPVNDGTEDYISNLFENNFTGETFSINKGNKRNGFYFHKKIGTNDLVYIRILDTEVESRSRDFFIDESYLPNKYWDMIGLVDSNQITVDPSSNNINIAISGSDLMKLLTTDGSYFIPISFMEGVDSYFQDFYEDKDKYVKRNFASGTYRDILFTYVYRTIDFSLQFLINQCSNIGIIPSSVFSGYSKEKKSKVFKLSNTKLPVSSKKLSTESEYADGLWQIVKLNYDSNLDDRRLNDSSISQPDGSIKDQIDKLCQSPFVEWWGDTIKDTYSIIITRPQFDKESILYWLENDMMIVIKNEDVLQETLLFNEDDIYTSYQINSSMVNFSGDKFNILPFVPVCYFPDYVDIWGNRRFFIEDIYASYNAIKDKSLDNKTKEGEVTQYSFLIDCIVRDMMQMIDMYSCTPFLRQGTIVINGDRRIKRGTWVYYEPTNECYYVEDVMNTCMNGENIDRTTTLSVKRGMIKPYIRGLEKTVVSRSGGSKTVRIGYFDIIDTAKIREQIQKNFDRSTSNKKQSKDSDKTKGKAQLGFGVNGDVFDFFMRRKQFD